MGPLFVRPPVSEVAFRLYDRPLHPELFDVVATRRVEPDGCRVTVRLTHTGHVLVWGDGRVHIEEVTATDDMELPAAGRRLAHKFGGGHGGRCALPHGIRYHVQSHLEVLAPEQFLHLHEELAIEGAKKGLVFHCRTHNRLGLSPLGVVIVQAVRGGFCTSAFHTFPDEFAVIKTQSLIERV